MPAGLFQPVGETGWQLSHGERSRIYMARALLQGADLVVLDESFAELDPDSLRRLPAGGCGALEEPSRGRPRMTEQVIDLPTTVAIDSRHVRP
jgi:ABC transporter